MDVIATAHRRCMMLVAQLRVRSQASSERGASLIEYALLVALIALVCFAAVGTFGGNTSNLYSDVGNSLN